MSEDQKKLDKKKEKEAEKQAKLDKFKQKQEAREAQATKKADEGEKKDTKKKEKKEEVVDPPFVNTTPVGSKKDTATPMRKSYDPTATEAAWYDWWNRQGYFTADPHSKKEPFVIVIPPPNVTGSLHLGHALTESVQDAIVRWNRMCGKEVLFVPGLDHAGISTQTVVEKKLMKLKGLTRHDLGREKFLEEVWKWKAEYGGRILSQLKLLGGSYDWTRECFTMDDKLSFAVTEAFVRMFNKGIIYRDKRLVNWDCKLMTAISDIEVEHLELDKPTKMKIPGHGDKLYQMGVLYDFAYKIEGTDEEIVVSTTRPETMLGDTAVVVHPDDIRYKHLHGKTIQHPFVNRKLKVVADSVLPKPEFGSGAVKVTPAHDPNDFACGQRHKLEFINILNDDGTINDNGAKFKGMKRYDAREAVVAELKKIGVFRGIAANPMSIAICSRSNDIIEPMIKPQWWVNCKDMAKRSVDAVRNKQLEIIPAEFERTWYGWLENIHDWCISRQLWWGHRCPAWLIVVDGKADWELRSSNDWVAAHSEAEALKLARSKRADIKPERITVQQDPDVLDTWFSSGLFPFSTMGWPNQTPDLRAFYPNALLETGHDILFFWVARMVMMGFELTDKLPFKQVLLHAMVRDAHGRKMSKTLGNVIDPLDMMKGITLEALHKQLESGNLDPSEIEKAKRGQKEDFPNGIPECGTDALRFALCAYTAQARDINLDISRVAAYRNFCNKLWNATKFVIGCLGDNFKPAPHEPAIPQKENRSPMERWILSRLQTTIQEATQGFQKYDFAKITSSIYSFLLYDFCDVFIEAIKPLIYSCDETKPEQVAARTSAREILYTCLDNGFRLLHPFMCFLTEELWQRLPRRDSMRFDSIMIAKWPTGNSAWTDEQIEKDEVEFMNCIKTIRAMRANFGLVRQRPTIILNVHSQRSQELFAKTFKGILAVLGMTGEVTVELNRQNVPAGHAVDIVGPDCDVYMNLEGQIDIAAEVEKIEKQRQQVLENLSKTQKTTEVKGYESKVPEEIRKETAKKLIALQNEASNLQKAKEALQKIRK